MIQTIPAKPLKIGVVGGGFGRTHIRAFQATPGVEVTAFCQRTRADAEKIAHDFAIRDVFTDYREMILRAGLDGLSLATPTNIHLAMVTEALEGGISVLCEKPLAMNATEAAQMLRRAETARLTHVTAFNFRFIPAFQQMKNLIQEGYVGDRILHVEAAWFAERRADATRPFGWRDQKETVGFGAMGDIGVHLVDLVRWLAGDLKRVCSAQAIFTKERFLPGTSMKREVTVEDCCIFIGELAEGGLVSFLANGAARGGSYQEIRILGNEGMLRVEIDRGKIDWMIGSLWGARSNDTPKLLPIPQPLTDSLAGCDEREAMAQFIFSHLTRALAHGIRTGESVAPNFHDGLEAQKILDAVVKSAQSSHWVTVE